MSATKLHFTQLISCLLLATLACRPVMTVGWQEIVILILVIAVLLGPALWKLYLRLAEFQAWKEARRLERRHKNKPD